MGVALCGPGFTPSGEAGRMSVGTVLYQKEPKSRVGYPSHSDMALSCLIHKAEPLLFMRVSFSRRWGSGEKGDRVLLRGIFRSPRTVRSQALGKAR